MRYGTRLAHVHDVDIVDARRHPVLTARHLGDGAAKLLQVAVEDVLDRGDDQIGLGGEVVILGAPRDPGALRDHVRRGVGVTVLADAGHGRVEQARKY